MATVLRSEKMPAELTQGALEELLVQLVTPELIFFPIRHHSPACAWHLAKLIRARKPRTILIEAPASFTSLIPLILHKETKAPFAVYTSFVGDTPADSVDSSENKDNPPRYAAYFPFCDYSPELVALRVGSETGAALRFIDLDYPEQIEAERTFQQSQASPRVESLVAEGHFKRSQFLQRLARRAGCRDHNDLWDHLFETRLAAEVDGNDDEVAAQEKFIRDVAAWCYFARSDSSNEQLEADGTLAREAAMARAIKEETRKSAGKSGPVLVVTGGFHTVALPTMLGSASRETVGAKKSALTCLVRYSFDQLDALNGYSAGMPSPFYYDQLWNAANTGGKSAFEDGDIFTHLAAKTLVQLGQLTREKKVAAPLSPADAIAALEQSRRLAALRGHPGPTREDLLDGIRSCFVKGAMDTDGELLLGLARHTLAGTKIGAVPTEAGMPPLVNDFRCTAEKLHLKISDSIRRKTSFDLYRKVSHRKASRFLHSLCFLEVPFSWLTAGPDFVKGTNLERLHEHWDYQWTPQTESRLVEASIYGTSIEEAAANRLVHVIAELETQGRGRSAAEGVGMLVHACRMGLHQHTARLRQLIAAQISEDPNVVSLANSLTQLILLWESREPLEAHRLPEIPQLIHKSYERACYLLHDLANTPPDAAEQTLAAVISIRDVLTCQKFERTTGEVELDPALYFEPIQALTGHPRCPALLVGGATGILRSADRIDDAAVVQSLAGYLNSSTSQPGEQTAFLIGLLRCCRELAWRQPALVRAVNDLLATWNEEEFINRLPHLRLAFADLTPAETDKVAALVAQERGGKAIGSLSRSPISEGEMMLALRINAAVKRSLKEDGLEQWLQLDAGLVAGGAGDNKS